MMEHLSIKTILSASTLAVALTLGGCDQGPQNNEQAEQTTEIEQINSNPENKDREATIAQDTQHISRGNMFYMVRDVADMQLKAGDYVAQLKQTQNELQTAINDKDQQQLQATAKTLQQQLTGFNQALTSLNLKSQEIDSIRQNILHANQQVLATPLLNGNIDLNQLDFKKIEQQMGSIQTEMIKLAGMMIPQGQDKQDQES